MKYSIITFGCRVNQADSFAVEEALRAGGGEAAPPESADVVIVNTCSVTSASDQSARQTIRRLARTNPHARVVVTGCYATREPVEVAALPNVSRVVPNGDKPRLLTMAGLMRSGASGVPAERDRGAGAPGVMSTAERFGDGDGGCGAVLEPGLAGRTAFTLRVQTGCAERCSYCIIPATRGTPRSVPLEDVLREAERVTAAGFREVVLTGVHLGSYGRDLVPSCSLSALLRRLDRHAGAVRFRISSLEPMDCTPAIVDLVAGSDRFAPHFHLPMQHASPRVLAAMRRPYSIAQYEALVGDIRRRMPHASIGSDVIVGFPGETDEDFGELVSFLDDSPLTHLHVFPYSDRPGTAASTMGGKVHGALVRDRAGRIREIGHRLAHRFRDAQVGTSHRALTLEDGSLALTGNYLKVRIPPGRSRNEWVRVRLTSPDRAEVCG